MEVYRITHSRWANKLTASGYAARWNSNGNFIIYSASSKSLACLESVVHRNDLGLRENFKIITIHIPNNLSVKTIDLKDLDIGWDGYDEISYNICRKIGDEWSRENSSLILIVPSAVIKSENNILINPNHPEFNKIKIIDTEPFIFDERIKS